MIMSRIFKGNIRTFTETIKLLDKKKLRNVTIKIIGQSELIRQKTFTDAKVMGLRKCH